MRILEVRSEEQFAELRASWNALLAASNSASTFLTWEWSWAWWKAYGNAGDLRILLALEGDELCAIAPLRYRQTTRYHLGYSILQFLADGSNDSDYLDFIFKGGCEAAALEAIWKHLEAELERGTILALNEIPESSVATKFLESAMARAGMVSTTADVACSVVSLEADWDAYLKKLAPRFRTKVRSVLRKLEGAGDVRMRFCQDRAEISKLHEALFDLHQRRWATEGKPGVFGWDRKRAFYEELTPLLLDCGALRFSVLEWRDRVLATQYGFVHRDRYFQLQEGYEPNCEHWNPGIALRAWTIREFISQGIRAYDFMGGTSRGKSDWGSDTALSKRMVLARDSAANILYCRGPEWNEGAKESIKRLVPKQIIESRRRAAKSRSAPARDNGSGETPTRGALAKFYYYSPLRWATPPLRNQYRLRVSRNGGVPKVALERRTEPSVRVLYFHRVNHERDPYFPSSSVEQFERELRYVAENYRIVSLREAVRRLNEGGPVEPAVAITFDDGYEDNCSIAYPILEKYGATATIFLTTGALDSQQPLWFEKLNLAMKKTALESIELELEIPRRFAIRTQAERLKAIDAIYWFLRNIPDRERLQRLAEIYQMLDVADLSDRDGRMLSWDQVRYLKSRGIDFGGHTVNHPFLSRVAPECAAFEVTECKRRVEEELQSQVELFAYPSGREIDFSEASKQAVRNAGYAAAVSTVWGLNTPSTDRLQLRRGQPWESDPSTFAAKFDWYQWVE